MTGHPKVSVIVPAYNAEAFVGRTLASLRAQTFTDFEAIVVDDGSTDGTAAVVAEIAAADPRVRLIRQPNGGVAAARNRALAEARGPYVANLDADDLWRPQFLERTLAVLEQAGEGAVFAFARSLWIDEQDRLLPQADIPLPRTIDYRELLTRNPVGNGSAMLMRTAAVREIGGYDAALVREFGPTEDWQLLLQLSWRGSVAAVDEPLVLYRILPQSSSHVLERSARGAMEVIRRCRIQGPRLRRLDYWAARSLTLLWLARRAWRKGRKALALQLAARAYLGNPLWFALRELRAPIVNALLPAPWRRAALPAPSRLGAPAA
ncbi:MAG: glycosyltransferase family 2 protein [Alphaproteobacteria bacterium]|nr:glycosyltransferase family 2 protein [Alphaproteobacteria bacterium]